MKLLLIDEIPCVRCGSLSIESFIDDDDIYIDKNAVYVCRVCGHICSGKDLVKYTIEISEEQDYQESNRYFGVY